MPQPRSRPAGVGASGLASLSSSRRLSQARAFQGTKQQWRSWGGSRKAAMSPLRRSGSGGLVTGSSPAYLVDGHTASPSSAARALGRWKSSSRGLVAGRLLRLVHSSELSITPAELKSPGNGILLVSSADDAGSGEASEGGRDSDRAVLGSAAAANAKAAGRANRRPPVIAIGVASTGMGDGHPSSPGPPKARTTSPRRKGSGSGLLPLQPRTRRSSDTARPPRSRVTMRSLRGKMASWSGRGNRSLAGAGGSGARGSGARGGSSRLGVGFWRQGSERALASKRSRLGRVLSERSLGSNRSGRSTGSGRAAPDPGTFSHTGSEGLPYRPAQSTAASLTRTPRGALSRPSSLSSVLGSEQGNQQLPSPSVGEASPHHFSFVEADVARSDATAAALATRDSSEVGVDSDRQPSPIPNTHAGINADDSSSNRDRRDSAASSRVESVRYSGGLPTMDEVMVTEPMRLRSSSAAPTSTLSDPSLGAVTGSGSTLADGSCSVVASDATAPSWKGVELRDEAGVALV